jgi:hypothetical protein
VAASAVVEVLAPGRHDLARWALVVNLAIRNTDSSLEFFGNDLLFAVHEVLTERWPWQTGPWTQTLDWPLNAIAWHSNEQ